MYNDPNFFDLVPGAIGTLVYKKNMLFGMTDAQKQAYVSDASNQRMRAFINNITYGMNGNGPTNPQDAYDKARRDSWQDLEEGQMGMETKEVQVQVDQRESYELILSIESREDFSGWTNPVFVDMLKEQYKQNENTGS